MAILDEALAGESQLNPDLAALRIISFNQEIKFTQYVRRVLPLDGYVFWMRGQSKKITGSLHYSSDVRQLEDETTAFNHIIFTTSKEVSEFRTVDPNTIWVGDFEGLRFSFAQHNAFYRAVGLYHYLGDSLNPSMATQLIEVGQQLLDKTLIVSNSLPAWLTIKDYTPEWLTPLNPQITLYPSFLVPANLAPPYGSVHIEPNGIQALQVTPSSDRLSSHFQLATERVRITLYGATNDMALDFFDTVNRFSLDTDLIGIMGAPAIMRDEKRTQVEFNILGMKKTIEFEVSYIQTRINDLARQMILSAIVTYYPQDTVTP